MTDPSLTNKLAALSPQQLAALRSRLAAVAAPMTVQPRRSLTTLPQGATTQVNGQTAWRATSTQARLWFIDQYLGPNPVYNVVRALRLSGQLDIPALEAACQHLVQRHEALRTTFHNVDGVPYQLIGSGDRFHLDTVDLRTLPVAEREAAWQQQLLARGRQPFNLATDSPLRVVVFQLGAADFGLLLVIHHLVSDGWSMGLLAKELSSVYRTLLNGSVPELPPIPWQFADYAVWLENQRQQEPQERHRQYWQAKLSGELPVLNLPCDRPRGPQQTYNGRQVPLQFDATLVQNLKALGLQTETSLFMVLLASFKVLLHRYTHQTDIIVGAPIANRSRAEFETIIGYFVDNLPLRTDLSGHPSFTELLQRVRQTALDAYAHPYPFADILQALSLVSDPSRSPVFSVMMSLQNTPDAELAFPGIQFTHSQISNSKKNTALPKVSLSSYQFTPDIHIARFDLTALLKEETDGAITGILNYNSDLFNRDTIERLIGHWQTLLQGILANPQTPISQLPLLTPAERQQILVDWNQTQTDYPQDKCIHQLFEEQVEKTPDAIAVIYRDQQLTYRELNQYANQLAHHLQTLGVGNSTLVGLCANRSLEMMIAMLAILKAGGAYVPLDPSYPHERLAFILADTQISVLLTESHLVTQFADYPCPVVQLDTDLINLPDKATSNPTCDITSEHLAYVMYTSGSTGQPKGVSIKHQGVVRLVKQTNYAHMRAEDRFLQLAPISFDAATLEIWGALLNGACLVLFPEPTPTPETISHTVQQHQITFLWLTAGLFHLMVNHGLQGLTSLRQLLAGGDVLSVSRVQQAIEQLPHCTFINGYGPTENTTFTCCYTVTTSALTLPSIPIGRPIANTQVYILDTDHQPVPRGIPGELYVGGDGLAQGYFNRPELTAERFIANPFGQGRLYKTGDWVRYLPNGNIEFLGRLDQQVKIRGFRIELGDVETVISQHPQVQTGIIGVHAFTPEDKRLVAYVVPRAASVPTVNSLRQWVQQRLPEYMVPSTFIFLASLPLTPNGKVDRKALPVPNPSERAMASELVAPRTPMEVQLSQIWRELLQLEQISIHDNFFELGGHSLLATQVMSRIRDRFALELPLITLFDAPTIASLAERMGGSEAIEATHTTIQPVSRTGYLPLSFAQQRLWFLNQLEGPNATYNVPIAVHLNGPLEIRVLARTIQEIGHRHEVLRTTFQVVDEQPVQVIEPHCKLPLAIIDRQGWSAEMQAAEVTRLMHETAHEPFDLSRDRLIRIQLLQLAPMSHVLLITMHHIIADGWSLGVFTRELATLYQDFLQGVPPSLPPLTIQYADFAHWQRQYLSGNILESQISYWQDQLADIPALLDLPTDFPRPPVQSFQGSTVHFHLNTELSQQLQIFSQQSEVTLFITLLTTFSVLLHRYSHAQDIVVGAPIANRNRQEIEPLIGFFANTLPLRVNLMGNPAFSVLLEQVRQTALDAYAYQDVPFEKLVEELKPERNLSYHPVFQVMFVLQNAPTESLNLPGLTTSELICEHKTAKFDLLLSMSETASGLRGCLEYRTDLFQAETIQRLVQHFQNLLQAVITQPQQSIAQLPLLSPAEHQQLLVDWNNTQADYPQDDCLHQLVEEQAERTPDAIAVVFATEQLTYGELNARANQLAHHLRELGVGPDVPVGICVERSLALVIGILAILKAGGAYVPLDPTYPSARLAYMLVNAQVPIVLTQQSLAAQFAPLAPQVLCLDRDPEDLAPFSSVNLPQQTVPTNLAYIIYTSGSTGQPKGIAMPHQALVNLITWQQQTAVSGQPRTLQFAPISFDVSCQEIFSTWCIGGTLVLISEVSRQDPFTLLQKLKDEQITRLFLPYIALQQLAEVAQTAEFLPTDLKEIITAGEQLQISNAIRKFLTRLSGCTLHNHYGPSESHVVTAFTLSGDPEQWPTLPPIGKPIANCQIYVLDQALAPVPIGVTGDLYIGGICLAREYFKRPDLTAERFIEVPPAILSFHQSTHTSADHGLLRLYKTGDVARLLPDGTIEFLGRADAQVKIRGFRIELGEIEATLAQHPQVQKAVVITREDHPGDKRLVAYVVAQSTVSPSGGELRQFLKQHLPQYMVPSAFVVLEALPLTPSGKVDRRALPIPDISHRLIESEFVAPRTPLEKQLSQMWGNLLNLKQVGIHDNFFELGGHSLLATQLTSRIRNELQVELPLLEIFDTPTIAELTLKITLMSSLQTSSAEATHEYQKLSMLIDELENLSEDEIQQYLTQENTWSHYQEEDEA